MCNHRAPGGGQVASRIHRKFLAGAAVVVVVADKDGPGRKHAATIARSLEGRVDEVRLVEARAGKDARDHLIAGHSPADFIDVVWDEERVEDDAEPRRHLVASARLVRSGRGLSVGSGGIVCHSESSPCSAVVKASASPRWHTPRPGG